jgi:hypothetical protein
VRVRLARLVPSAVTFGLRPPERHLEREPRRRSARDTNANMGYTVGEDGLSVQDADTLDASTLTPLSPEVISRQATINIGACDVSSRATRFPARRDERRLSRRAPRSRRP